jgi:hypothetical protein
MFKMSTCGVGLLLAGLVGLACSTTSPSDCEKAGGTCIPLQACCRQGACYNKCGECSGTN